MGVDQAFQVLAVAGLQFRRRVGQGVRQDLADDLAHLVDDAPLVAVVQVAMGLRNVVGRRQAAATQQPPRLLGLANHARHLAGVAGIDVQAGGEKVADEVLGQAAEQHGLARLAAADAADTNLRDLVAAVPGGRLPLLCLAAERGRPSGSLLAPGAGGGLGRGGRRPDSRYGHEGAAGATTLAAGQAAVHDVDHTASRVGTLDANGPGRVLFQIDPRVPLAGLGGYPGRGAGFTFLVGGFHR